MKVLIVLAHPRDTSLVYSIKNEFEKGLIDGGHEVNTLDLFKIGFDPVLREEDEPQWYEKEQVYSKQVHMEMERINQHDAVVFCFPLYWSSMPAIMKGYLDRVWNYGFAHAHDRQTTMKLDKILFIATTGGTEETLTRRNYIDFINRYFNEIIAGYCGVENSKVKLFHDSRNIKLITEQHIPEAYKQGRSFDTW